MTVIGPRAAIPSTGETRSEIRGEETSAASSGRRPFPGFFVPCPSGVEWSSCYVVGAGAVLGPFEAVGERGGDVESTDITFAVPVVRLKAMGRLPMLLVLGSVFLPSQTRCDRA